MRVREHPSEARGLVIQTWTHHVTEAGSLITRSHQSLEARGLETHPCRWAHHSSEARGLVTQPWAHHLWGCGPPGDQSRAGDELDAWVQAPSRAFMYRRGGSQCQGN